MPAATPDRRSRSESTSPSPRPSALRRAVGRRRAALALSATLSVLSAACALAPYGAVYLVTIELFGTAQPDAGAVLAIAAATALALLLRGVLSTASGHLAHTAAYGILADVRIALVEHLQRIPLGRVQARSAGSLKKVLHDDVEQLEEALAHGVPDLTAGLAVPLVTTAFLFAVDWRLALLALGVLVATVLLGAAAARAAQENNAQHASATTAITSAVLGYLRGMPVIRGFLRPDLGYAQARDAVERVRRAGDGIRRLPVRWLLAVLVVMLGFTVVIMLPASALLFLAGDITLATMALFLLLSLGYAASLLGVVGVMATIVTRVQLAVAEIDELLAEPALPVPEHPRTPSGIDIELAGVSFGYDPEIPVLHDVHLRVPAGANVALVGATGAGKSTLARLVARFWDVDAGAVRIGGVDVREIDPAVLMRQVALVQQDDYLFDVTLLENIRIGRPDATDDEVRDAARRARVLAFADHLPEGLGTVVGEGGARLSGGQRQRVSIARALLKGAPIVVLDEATSALDAASERATEDAVAELARGRTVITVAHRLSAIADADLIALVDDGRVVDHGDHESLLARCPEYRALWAAFRDAEGWRLEPATADAGIPPIATRPATPDAIAAAAVPPRGLADLGFFRQWTALLGRGWPELRRHGLVRLACEGLLRGAPVIAVFLVLRAAVEGTLDTALVWTLTAALVVLSVARVLAVERANDVVWRVSAQSKADLQLSLLETLRRVPMGFFARSDTGRLSTIVVNDVVMIDFQNVPQQLAATILQPMVTAVVLITLDWRLALAALAGVPAFLLLAAWSDRIHRRVLAPQQEAAIRATSVLLDEVRGTAVLRAYPGSAIAQRYRDAVEQLRAASVAMSVKAGPAAALSTIALELGSIALIVVGSELFAAGTVDATVLLLFLVLSLVLYMPLGELNALSGYRQTQRQIARRIAEICDAPRLVEPARPSTASDPTIELRHVSFGYEDSAPALRDVSLRAEPGTVTALVGPSGAGKSTVAALMTRAWDVDDGAVLIGGADVRDLGSAGVSALTTTVYQDVHLFHDTVRNNLCIGRPDATQEQIVRALEASEAAGFVARLPQGLDSVIGDGGASLSGGQRQRLSIARALLKDAPILILDEAVASVDPATEVRIQRAIRALAAGRTVVVIAHRLSTVQHADRIVVLADGAVDGVGTHDELLRGSAVYRELWEASIRPPADAAEAVRLAGS